MRRFAGIFFIFFGIPLHAQQVSDEEALRQTVETFFEGFHEQDSIKLKSVVADSLILQSLATNAEGESLLHTDTFRDFLKAITAIPPENTFREVLHSFSFRSDGSMANVWTPYTFYFNGKRSHCGVNSFQLLKEEGKWKIFYLVDTRRRGDCE